jgi:hypothetical protein
MHRHEKDDLIFAQFSITENTMIRILNLIVAYSSLVVLLCPPGFATELSLFTGGEIDNRAQGFSYLGLDLTKKVYKNISISGRLIPNFLTYKFRSGDNTVRAISPGLYTVAGIKLSWTHTTFGLFGGIEFRNTNLNPDVSNAAVRGNTLAGLIQGEFDTWLPSRTNLNAFASFSGTDSFLYQRARIKQQITNLDYKKPNTINAGVEEIFGRNPEFQQIGVGLILEIFNIPKWFSFAIRSGYKHDSTFGNGIYGGLEFYTRFK